MEDRAFCKREHQLQEIGKIDTTTSEAKAEEMVSVEDWNGVDVSSDKTGHVYNEDGVVIGDMNRKPVIRLNGKG